MGRIRSHLLFVSATLVLGLSAGGCAEDTFDPWSTGSEDDFAPLGYDSPSSLDVRSGALVGAVGPVGNLNHSASTLSGWSNGYWSSVEVVVDRGGDAAMTLLDITGDLRDLADGQVHTFDGSVWQQGLYISVLGCSGPEPGYWTFDESADEVTVEVREEAGQPGVYTIDFTASFDVVASEYQPIDGATEATTVSGTATVALDR